jgi:hypothetical protein
MPVGFINYLLLRQIKCAHTTDSASNALHRASQTSRLVAKWQCQIPTGSRSPSHRRCLRRFGLIYVTSAFTIDLVIL